MTDTRARKVVEECHSCGFGPVEATECEWPYGVADRDTREKAWLCDFCRGSRAGNAYLYGPNMYPEANVMHTIAACANILYAKLRTET